MKVGTDGVLLGAWTSLEHEPASILDIGTGSGVIALQLAQRSNAELIDAIELDDNAFEQAVENFENSNWSDRLFCYHASLQEFTQEIDDNYDLIVSNPPFHSENYETDDDARNKARFTASLPFNRLINAAAGLLAHDGIFAVIIPYKEEENFIKQAKENKLFPIRICHVKGAPNTAIKRSLLEFSLQKKEPKIDVLTIEIARHQYTKDYIELVKDFYLKM